MVRRAALLPASGICCLLVVTVGYRVSTHRVQVKTVSFQAINRGEKTYLIRDDDQDFAVGDTLILREWDSDKQEYTGWQLQRVVTYKTSVGDAPPDKMCVLALGRVQ